MSSQAPIADTPTPPGLVALVADGSVSANRIVRRVLGSLGITRVVEARDGAEALGALAERKPDLVVLDWRQTLVTASEIVACIRDETRSHAPGMPVVITMSDPTRGTVEAALALNVDAIVAKPYSTAALRARLGAAVFRRVPAA